MEGLSLPLHPRFSNRSNGNFFPLKVALLFFNSPVLQRRSGRCKAWPKDCFRNTTCAQFIGIFSKPGVTRGNSHSMPASKLGLFYRNETFRFQCAGPGISFSPGGFDSHVKTAKGTCAYAHTHTSTHTSGFLFRAGCVRLDLWVGNEASLCVCGSKSCNPPLPPSPSPLQTPLLLIWMTCQTKAIDANTLWFANAKNRGSKWGGLWVCHTGRKGREINKEFRVTNIRLY